MTSKKWLSLAACAVIPSALAGEPSLSAVMKRLEQLQKQVQQQQTVIEQLKAQQQEKSKEAAATAAAAKPGSKKAVSAGDLSAMVKQQVDAEMQKRALAEANNGPILKLTKGIQGLKIKGDMRLRYEYRHLKGDPNNPNSSYAEDVRQKQRFRHRIRLGGIWTNPTENWQIGLGMQYGSSDAKSSNQSWNSNQTWQSGNAYLDYAYVKYMWDNGLSLTLGQQINPFVTSYVMFDGDLRPTGATLHWANDRFFATAAAYNIRGDTKIGSSANQSTANMFAGQFGVNVGSKDLGGRVALAGYLGDSGMNDYVTGSNGMNNQKHYKYQIGDLYGDVHGKVGEVKVKTFGEYVVNFGADSGNNAQAPITQLSYVPGTPGSYRAKNNNSAWVLGLGLSYRRFKAGYSYAHIEGDSVPWMFTDSDFGDGLPDGAQNAEGHKLSVGYKISDHCEADVTAILTQPIRKDYKTNDLRVGLYQFDLNYKF